MANSINWGEIYNTTYWGNPINGGWGNIYYEYTSSLYPITLNFQERVLGDGGIFLDRNLSCVNVIFDSETDTLPVIKMTGRSISFPAYTGTYTDAGATAQSLLWGDITSDIVTTDNVQINVSGLQYIKYNVVDELGLNAVEVKREVYATGWFASKYNDRIVADGGLTECLRPVDEKYGKYNWEFYYKVLADGGTIDHTTLECSQELTKNFNYDFLHRVETDSGIVERIECVII
jgi:hypothetical protein